MGCDIHLYAEHLVDESWRHLPDPEGAKWADPTRWFHDRNYYLFSILADVRNGVGFASTRTGDGFTPIVAPRGLPTDVSEAVRSEADEWGIDGHSHSYLTVAEILAFDWDQMTKLTTLVHDTGEGQNANYAEGGMAEAVERFANQYHELPRWAGTTCSGVSGPRAHMWKRITWTQSYYRCAGKDWWGTVARAARIAGDSLGSVRLVYWFDN